MDLKSALASGHYAGIVTLSDLHAHAKKLKKAIRFALKNDLFIVFLGDLVDGHDKPLETVLTVKTILDQNRGVLVIGNHDDKFYRYALGNKVQLKAPQKKTLADVPKGKMDLFLQTYIDLIRSPNSAHIFRYGKWTFTHAAIHPDVWSHEGPLSKKMLHRAMYGETTGERDEEGFPVRTYDWVEGVPSEQNVVVGHDRSPYGGKKLRKTGPLQQTNAQQGRVFFTDMGCGKTKSGKLCLTVLDREGNDLEFVKHKAI